MHTQNARIPLKETIKRTPTAPPVWSWDPGPGPGLPGPRPWGAVGLRSIVFSMGFLHFGYAYALIGLEINIRLDLISNVCIIIPGFCKTIEVGLEAYRPTISPKLPKSGHWKNCLHFSIFGRKTKLL